VNAIQDDSATATRQSDLERPALDHDSALMVTEVPSKPIPDGSHDTPSRVARARRDKNSKGLKPTKEQTPDLDVVAMSLPQENNGDALQVLSNQGDLTSANLRGGLTQGPRAPGNDAEDALGKPQEGDLDNQIPH